MTDYLTQCNAITAEKKVWRWAKYVPRDGTWIGIRREDHHLFDVRGVDGTTHTEYDGDADGNPIPAMLGTQELWDRHGLYVAPNGDEWDVFSRITDFSAQSLISKPTYAAAIAEANRIAGGS